MMLCRLVLGFLVLTVVLASPTRYTRQSELDNYEDTDSPDIEYYDELTTDEPEIEISAVPSNEDVEPAPEASLEEEDEGEEEKENGNKTELPVKPQPIPSGSEDPIGPDSNGEKELHQSTLDILHISGDTLGFGDTLTSGASGSSGASGTSGLILGSGMSYSAEPRHYRGSGYYSTEGSADIISGASGDMVSEGSVGLGSGLFRELASGASGELVSGDFGDIVIKFSEDISEVSGDFSGVSWDFVAGESGYFVSGISGDLVSGVSGDLVSGVSGDFVSGVSGDFVSGVSGDFVSGVSGDFVSGVSGDFVFEVSGDFVSSVSGDFVSGVSEDFGCSGVFVSGVSEDMVSGISGNYVSGVSGDMVSGASGDSVFRTSGDTVSGASGDTAIETSGDLVSSVSGDFVSGISGDLVSGVSGDFVSGISGDLVSSVSGEFVSGISGDYVSGVSGDMISGVSGDLISGSSGFSGEVITVVPDREEEFLLTTTTEPKEAFGGSGESGESGELIESGTSEESKIPVEPGFDFEEPLITVIPDIEEELFFTTQTPSLEGTGGTTESGEPDTDLDTDTDIEVPGMPTCLLCTCLGTSVYCDDLKLVHVPPLPKDTTHFYARYNKITKINKSDFANMKKLKRIDLTNNAISKIEDGALFGLPALEELLIRENNVAQLPALPNTMTLVDASHNRLGSTGIQNEAFKDMGNLLYLYLTDNGINHVPVPLPESLRSLHLQNNNIQMLHTDTFCHLNDLNYIRNALEDIRLDENPINLSRTPQAYVCLPRIPVGALI